MHNYMNSFSKFVTIPNNAVLAELINFKNNYKLCKNDLRQSV